jgi:nucleoside-diphosphate-sugar epimerase
VLSVELLETIGLRYFNPHLRDYKPIYRDFRAGDIMHSQADIGKAKRLLGYEPTHSFEKGIDEALGWYVNIVNEALILARKQNQYYHEIAR